MRRAPSGMISHDRTVLQVGRTRRCPIGIVRGIHMASRCQSGRCLLLRSHHAHRALRAASSTAGCNVRVLGPHGCARLFCFGARALFCTHGTFSRTVAIQSVRISSPLTRDVGEAAWERHENPIRARAVPRPGSHVGARRGRPSWELTKTLHCLEYIERAIGAS